MRVLWIEDHQLVGDSLEMWLQFAMPDVSLDKARNVDAAIRLVEAFKYELILLDWWIGAKDGEFAIRALHNAGCRTPVVVVSGDDREPIMRRALELGPSREASLNRAANCRTRHPRARTAHCRWSMSKRCSRSSRHARQTSSGRSCAGFLCGLGE